MPKRVAPECVEDAFSLYLKYNGERFDLIEKEMRLKGWTTFDRQILTNRGLGENFREGWIERYGWRNALERYLSAKSKTILTSGERLYEEVETIRLKIFEQIERGGVNNRDLVWQHDKYSQRSAEILAQIENARNAEIDFARFFNWLLTVSIKISPNLARELCNAEEAIIKHAKDEFRNK